MVSAGNKLSTDLILCMYDKAKQFKIQLAQCGQDLISHSLPRRRKKERKHHKSRVQAAQYRRDNSPAPQMYDQITENILNEATVKPDTNTVRTAARLKPNLDSCVYADKFALKNQKRGKSVTVTVN